MINNMFELLLLFVTGVILSNIQKAFLIKLKFREDKKIKKTIFL